MPDKVLSSLAFEMDHENEKPGKASLRPFKHQVGGHYAMMELNDHSVCKPLNETELLFYKTTPDAIRQFVPGFQGTISVENDHPVAVGGGAGPPTLPRIADTDDTTNSASGSGEAESEDNRTYRGCQQWTKSDFMKPKKRDRKTSVSNEFLVLENVVARFHRPSIIDIKMGTRQHGDDATKEKIDRQCAKCKFTTSSGLGLRICGMKVFQHSENSYMRRDKYFGRKLTTETFKTGLLEFLQPILDMGMNGLIEVFVRKLQYLEELIKQQISYRFYSSSLLLVYDSEPEISDGNYDNCVDVRMIDFAHATNAMDGSGHVHKGPDEGYLFGLRNLIRFLEEIFSENRR